MSIKSNFPSIRPSLNLDFANTKRLDPRITFSRASSATYVDANGVIQTAAANVPRFDHDPATGESLGLLVEEGRTNLRTYSTAPNANYAYRVYGTAIPNAGLAPDGTATATLITGGGTINQGFDNYSNDYGNNQGAIETYSVYVKNVNATNVYIVFAANNASYQFTFATETGVLNGGVAGGFQKLSGGWYRIWLADTKANQFGYQQVFIDSGNSTSASMYFWGVQLEIGSFPTSLIPTPATFTGRSGTATYYDANGTIQTAGDGVARSSAYFPDSNGVMRPAGLLLEAAATNLVTYSEQFDNAVWGKNAVTVTANNAAAPDGTTTADKLIPTASNASHYLDPGTAPNTVANNNYSFSVFAKAAGLNTITIENGFGTVFANATVNLTSGAVTTASNGGTVVSATAQQLPNGWWRIALVSSLSGFSGYTNIYAGGKTAFTGNGTDGVLIWGAQLESGSYASSYIPTVASTVTRNADTSTSGTVTRSADVAQMTGTNFSSWYRQDEGTLFWSFRSPAVTVKDSLLFRISNATPTDFIDAWIGNSGTSGITLDTPGGRSFAFYSRIQIVNGRYALAMKANSFAISRNGETPLTDTSGAMTTSVDRFLFALGGGYEHGGTIARLAFYPVRLTDTQLQNLTR